MQDRIQQGEETLRKQIFLLSRSSIKKTCGLKAEFIPIQGVLEREFWTERVSGGQRTWDERAKRDGANV